jgi:hypothetical protein
VLRRSSTLPFFQSVQSAARTELTACSATRLIPWLALLLSLPELEPPQPAANTAQQASATAAPPRRRRTCAFTAWKAW